ncbi:TetR family transcriptional regulator [Leucobacter sp. GX0328]
MTDDRTARAKLRDAAIEIVAEGHSRDLTARGVAERAGLSAGLIRHHFGSMAALLTACDDHVAAAIRRIKESAIRETPGFDALTAIRASGDPHLMGYLSARVADDSPLIDHLVDLIVDDASAYMAEGTELGIFTPTADERARAAVLTVFALGSLSLHRHLKRLMGVDLRAADLTAQPGFARYLRTQMEIFAGVATPDAAARYGAALDELQEEP